MSLVNLAVHGFPLRVNEVAARLVAGSVAALLSLALLLGQPALVSLLALGFLVRVSVGPRYSLLSRVAQRLATRWPARPVAGAPKRFAQGIGALFLLSASALFVLGAPAAGWGLAGAVLLFATLEAGLGFCAGCFVYAHLQRAGLLPVEACVDCVRDESSLRPGAAVESAPHVRAP